MIPLSELYKTYVQNGKLIIELQATIALDETATTCLIENYGVNTLIEISPSLATFMFKDNASKDATVVVGDESFPVKPSVIKLSLLIYFRFTAKFLVIIHLFLRECSMVLCKKVLNEKLLFVILNLKLFDVPSISAMTCIQNLFNHLNILLKNSSALLTNMICRSLW